MPERSDAALEVVTPHGARRVVSLTERPITLGRSPDCDVVIEESFVSGHHARIEPSAAGYVLRDIGSTNGTWLDGAPVNGGKALAHGSSVVLGQPGNYSIRFVSPSKAGSRTGSHRNLLEVLEISKALLSTHDLEEVLRRVLDACLRITRAERGYLFLGEGGDLRLQVSRDEANSKASQQQVEFSRSIARRVAETGRAEFLDLDSAASRNSSDSVARLRLQSVACVPLKIQERVIGIVYLDSHLPAGAPDATGRDVVEVLAGLAAVAIENARMIEERVQNERWLALGRMAGSIVHDIRNPLTAIRVAAEVMENKLSDPHHKERLKLMIGEVDRLARLSGEMLEFSSGALPLNRSLVSLTQLVQDLLRAIEPRLEQETIRQEVRLDCDRVLSLDRLKMARVLHNLVGNALDAMQPGGTLTLESCLRGDRVVLIIGDTGCGMDRQTLSRLFEPFFTKGKEEGVGLGMAIARRIAEQHGATISVQSAPGAGTRVELSFPLTPQEGLR